MKFLSIFWDFRLSYTRFSSISFFLILNNTTQVFRDYLELPISEYKIHWHGGSVIGTKGRIMPVVMDWGRIFCAEVGKVDTFVSSIPRGSSAYLITESAMPVRSAISRVVMLQPCQMLKENKLFTSLLPKI